MASRGCHLEVLASIAAIVFAVTAFGAGVPNRVVNDVMRDRARSTVQSEPTIVQVNGNIVVAFVDSGEQTFYRGSGFAQSVDGGRHFIDRGAPPPPVNGLNVTDPVLDYDSAGNIYFLRLVADFRGTLLRAYIGMSKSVDGGWTFGPPVDVSPGTPRNLSCVIQDKPWMAIDRSGGTFDGAIYVAWTQLPSCPEFEDLLYFSRSLDGGVSFSAPRALASNGFGAYPAVDREGVLYIAWLEGQTMRLVRSLDGGDSFTAVGVPTGQVFNFFWPVAGGVRAFVVPNLAFGASGDTAPPSVYMTWHDGAYAGAPNDVFFARSEDRGESWSPPIRVNDDGTATDQFAPALHVAANGTIGILYYDRRNDPENNLALDAYLSQSLNGGRSFLPAARMSEVSSPPAVGFDPLVHPQFFGDYVGLSADARRFLAVWGDARRQITVGGRTRPDLDVVFAAPRIRRLIENGRIIRTGSELAATLRLAGCASPPDGMSLDPLSSDFTVSLATENGAVQALTVPATALVPLRNGRTLWFRDWSGVLADGVRSLALRTRNGRDYCYRLRVRNANVSAIRGPTHVAITIGGAVLEEETEL